MSIHLLQDAKVGDTYVMILRPSVCLSHHATAAPTCGRLGWRLSAVGTPPAALLYWPQHGIQQQNASSVTFKADIDY